MRPKPIRPKPAAQRRAAKSDDRNHAGKYAVAIPVIVSDDSWLPKWIWQQKCPRLKLEEFEKLDREAFERWFGEFVARSAPATPILTSVPKEGAKCPYTNLSRSIILDLILPRDWHHGPPPVRSILIRKPGTRRGLRRVFLDSLLAYCDQEANRQASIALKGSGTAAA